MTLNGGNYRHKLMARLPRVTDIPVDRLAARVVSKGSRYESKKVIDQLHWEIRPKLRCRREQEPYLVGKKFGQFTVVGIYYKTDRTRWVCRCTCGHFEVRKKKAILNPRNKSDRCELCRELEHLIEKDYFNRHGRWREEHKNVR